MSTRLPRAGEIIGMHDEDAERWGADGAAGVAAAAAVAVDSLDGADLLSLVRALHAANFTLWTLEDDARRAEQGDTFVADAKRAIDARNQRRNDLIERLDECTLAALVEARAGTGAQHSEGTGAQCSEGARGQRSESAGVRGSDDVGAQHSETAGMILDRLSILALKIRNMRRHAARGDDAVLAADCARKAQVLEQQRADLGRCFDLLIDDCVEGRRHFKVYRQFKAYNDPRLSPDKLR
jgi:hypothetical protein